MLQTCPMGREGPPGSGFSYQGDELAVIGWKESRTTETDQNITQSLRLSRAEFDALLRRLNFANTRRNCPAFARRADPESWSYSDFLGRLLVKEGREAEANASSALGASASTFSERPSVTKSGPKESKLRLPSEIELLNRDGGAPSDWRWKDPRSVRLPWRTGSKPFWIARYPMATAKCVFPGRIVVGHLHAPFASSSWTK